MTLTPPGIKSGVQSGLGKNRMIFVREAKYLEAYRVVVTFSDGVTKLVDLRNVLTGPVFQALQDPSLFSQFRVDPESETLVWPMGQISPLNSCMNKVQ